MQLRNVQSDDKDPVPSETPSSREQVCSDNGKIEAYTWSHAGSQNQRIPNAPTFETDPSNEPCAWKKWQGNQLGHCTRTCTKFQFQILGNEIGSPNQVPRAMFPHHLFLSGASLYMMSKVDLTSDKQETIQKSKDPSVIMSVNGNTHTTEEATAYVCDSDVLLKFNY